MQNFSHTSSSRALTSQSGFTLVELVMVISLLSILAYYGISRMGDMSSYSLDGALQKVMTDLRYAQSLSMSSGSAYGFRVTGPTSYEVYKVSDGTIPNSPYTGLPMQEDFSQTFKGCGFAADDYPAHQVEFDSMGVPTVGGGEVIKIQTTEDEVEDQYAQQITVSSSSGLISSAVAEPDEQE